MKKSTANEIANKKILEDLEKTGLFTKITEEALKGNFSLILEEEKLTFSQINYLKKKLNYQVVKTRAGKTEICWY